jgi:hypothetical protein
MSFGDTLLLPPAWSAMNASVYPKILVASGYLFTSQFTIHNHLWHFCMTDRFVFIQPFTILEYRSRYSNFPLWFPLTDIMFHRVLAGIVVINVLRRSIIVARILVCL